MSNRIFNPNSLHPDLATFLLRLIVGSLFTYYGFQKIQMYNDIAPNFPDLIGIGGKLSFILVIFAEFVCGILVAVGFLTRLSIIPIFIAMIVAYFIAHANDPFQAKQSAFIFMVLSPVIFISGSGTLSVDHLIFKKPKKY